MGLILGMLALVPLLSLVPLHWFWSTGSRGGLEKAAWLSLSASLFWAWLAVYVCAEHPGRRWFFYALLLTGTAFCAFCVWSACEGDVRVKRMLFVLAAFPTLYLLNAWCLSLPVCAGFHARRGMAISNARLGIGR
jgi:hypothetical protein